MMIFAGGPPGMGAPRLWTPKHPPVTPLIPSPVWKEENVNDVVTKIGELTGVKIREDDISVCHRLPQRRGGAK
jgi:hypothetical protein